MYDNEKGINHIRWYYQDENYRSSPGNEKTTEMRKLRLAAGTHTKGGSIIVRDREPMSVNAFSKIACTTEKPNGKMHSQSRPPQLAAGDERDY